MARSPYEVLGVSQDATPDEIKKAYRKKARENHPDLNPGDAAAAERMNEVNEAYDRLMNPQKYAQRDYASGGASGYGAGYGAGSGYGSSAGAGYGAGSGYGAGAGYGAGSGAGTGYGAGHGSYGSSRGSSSQGGSQQGSSGPHGWASDFGFDFEDFFGGGFGAENYSAAPPEPSATDSAEVRQAISFINAGRYSQATAVLNAIPSYGRDARWHYLSALANHGAGNEMLALDQIRRACEMDPNNTTYQQAMRSMRQPASSYHQQAEQQGFSVGAIDPMAACCGCIALQSCCYPMLCFRPF